MESDTKDKPEQKDEAPRHIPHALLEGKCEYETAWIINKWYGHEVMPEAYRKRERKDG